MALIDSVVIRCAGFLSGRGSARIAESAVCVTVRRPWAAWMTLGLAADLHVGIKPPSGRGVHAEIGAMAACGPIAVGVAFTPCVLCRRGGVGADSLDRRGGGLGRIEPSIQGHASVGLVRVLRPGGGRAFPEPLYEYNWHLKIKKVSTMRARLIFLRTPDMGFSPTGTIS